MRKLRIDEMNRVTIPEFKGLSKLPIVCVLDNIRSQHNIGSVFRTSDAFLIERLILCGITATPPNREIQKTALGATESMEWSYYPEVTDAITELKSAGYKIVAIEQAEGSIPLEQYHPQPGSGIALIFGNEVNGVSEEVMKSIDACVEIPQFGTKHSLNVSITAGIVMWHLSLIFRTS